MTARCPEGHLSDSADYCDVCGAPMGAQAAPAAPAGATPSAGAPVPGADEPPAATLTCPHCGAPNVADALFCEACGYDFTTGTPPMDDGPGVSGAAQEDPAEGTASEEPAVAEDGEVEPDEDDAAQDEIVEDEPLPDLPEPIVEAEPEPTPQPEPATVPEPAAAPEPQPEPAARAAHPRARHAPPSRALAEAWVVELWVDPDWYAVQQTEESCPSPGVPDIVLLTRSTALVGRPSGSLGARPEIDVGADSAVSRRHARLTSDGQRWWVEDLGSSNGTFVGTVGEPLPTQALTPGQRVEIDRDDRLYVGAWTRIVLRQATRSESEGLG